MSDRYEVNPSPPEPTFVDLVVEEAAEDLPPEEEEPVEERIPSKFERLLGSRKFWAALVALGLVVVKGYHPEFPLDQEQVTNLVYVLVAYILGVAVEDGLTAKALHA